MKPTATTYILIACASFVILAAVQLYLVSNTYELKNERYYFSEKANILDKYSQSVMHDVMIPGGRQLMDSIIIAHTPQLKQWQQTDTQRLQQAIQQLANSLFQALQQQESIALMLAGVKRERNITDSLEYALMIEYLDIPVGNVSNMNIYSMDRTYPLIQPQMQEAGGARIGGNLRHMDNQNRVVRLTVGSASDHLSRLQYSLYVEPRNRQLIIFGQMSLTLILSLIALLAVVVLFFVTFRNWIRQKKLSEMKSDFINNVTHEFHTPLTAIQVATKSLQNEKINHKKENIQSLTGVLQRQSDRLQHLISQVLDLTTQDKLVLNKKNYAVNHLLDELLLDYRLNLSEQQVNLVFDQKAATDAVSLDQFHFTTILINILDNAIKYNDAAIKEVIVSTASTEHQLLITVKDNGPGMSGATRKHIFEKFYRGNNGHGRQIKGLGLGLFYVQQSIRAHQWAIEVTSHPGKGTCITIIMPLQQSSI